MKRPRVYIFLMLRKWENGMFRMTLILQVEGEKSRHLWIITRIKCRKERKAFESKKDYMNNL